MTVCFFKALFEPPENLEIGGNILSRSVPVVFIPPSLKEFTIMDSINTGVCVQWSYFISVFIRFTAENLCCGTHIRSVGTVRVYCKNRGACKPEDMIIFKVLYNRLVHISKLRMLDEDYYILTLAAIARELNIAKIYSADVLIAAGLPLTWVSEQREEFKQYLLKNETVDFNFKGKDYHIRIVGADVYPQGFAAIVNHLSDFSGVNMLCDIGNGTMNIMFVNDKKPNPHRCFTEKFGTHQCMLHIRENLMRIHHAEPPEEMITRVLRFGATDIDGDYLKTISNTAKEYVEGIFRRLREHGYDSKLMKLYIVGGGGCMIRNFAEYDESRITVNDDICATAKGYERMLEMKLIKNGGAL